MPRDSGGNFTRGNGSFNGPTTWQQQAASGDPTIASPRHDTHDQDLADALTDSLSRSAKGGMQADLAMGGNQITNLGDAAALLDAANVQQIQDNAFNILTAGAPAGNAYTATALPTIARYKDGQTWYYPVPNDNTGNITLDIDSVGVLPVHVGGGAEIPAGEWVTGAVRVLVLQSSVLIDLNARASFAEVGDTKMTALSTVPSGGWWAMNGDTIGSAASGATHAADDQEALFEALWIDWPNLVVSGGRGIDGPTDWAADKTLELPNMGSQSPMAAGTGAGLTARTLGDTLGEEGHVQTEAELANHGHPWRLTTTTQGSASAGPTGGLLSDTLHTEQNQAAWNGTPSSTQGRQIGGTGSSSPMNVIQPSMVFNFWIKY